MWVCLLTDQSWNVQYKDWQKQWCEQLCNCMTILHYIAKDDYHMMILRCFCALYIPSPPTFIKTLWRSGGQKKNSPEEVTMDLRWLMLTEKGSGTFSIAKCLLDKPIMAMVPESVAIGQLASRRFDNSLGYHLDECWLVTLMLMTFLKIRNLVVLTHFKLKSQICKWVSVIYISQTSLG